MAHLKPWQFVTVTKSEIPKLHHINPTKKPGLHWEYEIGNNGKMYFNTKKEVRKTLKRIYE